MFDSISDDVRKGKQPNQINITLALTPDSKKDEGDFGAVEMAMAMSIAAGATEEGKKVSPHGALVATYGVIGSVMEETIKKRKGFAAKYYAPYFIEMEKNEHVEGFVCHAWQGGRVDGSEGCAKEGEAKRRAFRTWSEGYQWRGR